jgi:hypothetical protein
MLEHHASSSTSRLSELPQDQLDRLVEAPAFPHVLQFLARGFGLLYENAPRISSLFASQQRWLLCHVGLALHFRSSLEGTPGLTRRRLALLAVDLRLASRNTAHAFFDEALKYGVIRPSTVDGSERIGEVELAPGSMSMLIHWYDLHFQALDRLDGGDRSGRFMAQPERVLARLAPIFAPALLSSTQVRMPGPFYTIFTWADAGGNLMDRLIAGIDICAPQQQGRLLTDIFSLSHLAQAFTLSRAHTSRKFAEAEAIGGIGWSGRRGRSPMWIAVEFYQEYARAQAQKLCILNSAFAEAIAT